ncbi:hypothetical protein [Plantactinospora endophytica]|uniref:Excalibur calcium-binding domain-containing protein n=1 Tax=Plantactinospora endophytica TaxID=673535 RepID=A0ABQ4E876_9ACTN|nr:hypothetical protein [Plantactinospora endophytica]GIG90482.1 hypothetical protein Pen02_54180 [Plantactinospora endophytica]
MSRWFRAVAGWVRASGRRGQLAVAAGLVLLVLVVGVVGVLVAGGGDSDILWGGGTSATPADEPAEESGGESEPGQRPDAPDPTGPVGAPPPYVQPFAQQPGAKPRGAGPSPTAGVEIAEGTDGCDHAYGDRDVCVPWKFPDGVTDRCGWLRERGFEPLKITGGRDRHGLDRNDDGTACGAGD